MAKFKVTLFKEWVMRETAKVEVEADNADQAGDKAIALMEAGDDSLSPFEEEFCEETSAGAADAEDLATGEVFEFSDDEEEVDAAA